jgi:hypothetical protein
MSVDGFFMCLLKKARSPSRIASPIASLQRALACVQHRHRVVSNACEHIERFRELS